MDNINYKKVTLNLSMHQLDFIQSSLELRISRAARDMESSDPDVRAIAAMVKVKAIQAHKAIEKQKYLPTEDRPHFQSIIHDALNKK